MYISSPVYFVTFCTRNHQPLLAYNTVHEAFIEAAKIVGRAGNAVGRYVIMPDHVHVFLRIASAGQLGLAVKCIREGITKRLRKDRPRITVWQGGFFDHLMRTGESYSEKWAYVRENPVRAGLVKQAEEWPYQGEVEEIRW